jgi:L,D-transpeptidase YbiS
MTQGPEEEGGLPPQAEKKPPAGGAGLLRRLFRWGLLVLLFLVLPLTLFLAFLWISTGYGYRPLSPAYVEAHTAPFEPPEPGVGPEAAAALARTAIAKIRPKGVFIVIDRVKNLLYLKEGDQVLLKAVVSAGAGSVLDDPKTGRRWVFDTPTGRFFVKNRRENPVWVAPDWDYIESGEPLPKRFSDRIQEGMLGEYALDLGGGPPGYMIHGTLYTRLLGRNVSHGCIRVGRDDLRVVWKKTTIGTVVYMY